MKTAKEELAHALIRIAGSAHALLNDLDTNGYLSGPTNGLCIAAMVERANMVQRAFEALEAERREGRTPKKRRG